MLKRVGGSVQPTHQLSLETEYIARLGTDDGAAETFFKKHKLYSFFKMRQDLFCCTQSNPTGDSSLDPHAIS